MTIGICAGGTRYKPVKVDRDDFAGATSREKFPHALAEFKRLPFYKEREKQNPDGPDIAILRQIQADGIFPDPFGPAMPVYLKMLGKFAGEKIEDFFDCSQETLDEFSDWYADSAGSKPIPKALAPFVVKAKTTDDEYDPFADE